MPESPEKQLWHELISSMNTIRSHSLVLQLRSEKPNINVKKFVTVARIRLAAAQYFDRLAAAILSKARETEGAEVFATEVESNIRDENGDVDGVVHPEAAHATWRENLVRGLDRVSRLHGIVFDEYDAIDLRTATTCIERLYGDELQEMIATREVPFLAGAFTALEAILWIEFMAMRKYIRQRLKELTDDESRHIFDHATHEREHLLKLLDALIRWCYASPELLPDMIHGIRTMTSVRMHGVLDVIELYGKT